MEYDEVQAEHDELLAKYLDEDSQTPKNEYSSLAASCTRSAILADVLADNPSLTEEEANKMLDAHGA